MFTEGAFISVRGGGAGAGAGAGLGVETLRGTPPI
jgi:hypothetical protein